MTKLEKLLTELERLNNERTPKYSLEHPKMRFNKNDLIGVDCCDCCEEEPFVIAQFNRGMENWKKDSEFILACANALPQLIKVIRIQNKALKLYACDESYEVCDARLALARVEELL